MHHHIQVFVVGIPIHCHNTSQSGGKLLSVFLSESCFGCIEAPDAAMEFQFRAGIKSGEAWPATGCEFQVLTCIGWSSERNIHISFIIKGNGLRHMPMKSMGVIISKDHFHFTFRNQFPRGEFIPVKGFCRTVIEISIMDPHRSSITTLVVIVAKGGYGTAMRNHDGYLYYSSAKALYRNKLTPGKLIPESEMEVVLTDDHTHGLHWHMTKPVSFDDKGNMYVPFGAPSNACQDLKLTPGGRPGFAGLNPCPELELHGGIWRFDASRTGLTQKDGQKFATGLRSIVAMDWNPDDKNLYVVMHGRDDLFMLFPEYYSSWQSALLPSEDFLKITEGSDAGWPYYYYDQIQGKKMLAPEYGGDGKKEGKGRDLLQPVMGFSGHWAPNDLLFYHGDQFPEHYKHGAFVAFHGSTNRAPYPQSGYFVGFVPFKNGER